MSTSKQRNRSFVLAAFFAIAKPFLLAAALTGLLLRGAALACIFTAVALAKGVLEFATAGAVLLRCMLPAAFLLMPLAVCLAVVAIAVMNPIARNELSYAHERSSMPGIFDARGRFIGIYPPSRFRDWSDGSVLPPDHMSIPLTSVPSVWRACLVHLEDRRFDGVSSYLGFDPLHIAKSAWENISGNRQRGASTLLMQVTRMLYGKHPDDREPLGRLMVRKVAEFAGANALAAMLRSGDPKGAERYLGMHLPLVQGVNGSRFGTPLFGIELAAQILWGKTAANLAPEEQALLAAAVKRPIVLAPPSDEAGQSIARARWARVKERASFCLQAVLPEAGAAEILTRLNEMPAPQPYIDGDLRSLLPGDTTYAWQIAANPVRRSLYFAGQEISLIGRELQRLAGDDWRGRIAAIYISDNSAASFMFRRNIDLALRNLQASSSGQLVQDLTGGPLEARARVNVAIQDDDGLVRMAYSSHADMFANRTAVASTAKIGAAIALGRVDRPNALYCAKKPPQGRICALNDPRLTARVAFARSDNASILHALDSRPATRRAAAEIADILGLNAPSIYPVSALTLGLAELTPAELLRTLRVAGLGYCGQAAPAGEPRFVNAVTVLDPNTGDGVVVASKENNEIASGAVSRLFDGERGRRFFAAVLEAVLQPGGSLAALGDLAEAKTERLFAKTGTHSVSGATRALTVAGILLREGKPWTFIVTVAPAHHGEAIGREMTASHLAPLVRILLSAARPAPLRLDGTNEAGK